MARAWRQFPRRRGPLPFYYSLLQTLSDTFLGSRDATKWTQFTSSATVAQSGGVVTATLAVSTVGSNYAGYDSLVKYNLIGNYGLIQIVTPVNAAVGAQQYLKLSADASNTLQFMLENGTLQFQKTVATVTSNINAGVTFNATTHKWWRLRESGGTTFFDTSPDSITWTNQASLANPITLTALTVEFAAGTYQSVVSPGTGVFDNFNIIMPLVSNWKQPVNQPLRSRVPKRQIPPKRQPPPLRTNTAPYVSYWKQPVNQPRRVVRRQQPWYSGQEPFYGISVTPATPIVTSWKKPVNQPLRSRLLKRQQVNRVLPNPPQASQAPYLSYWIRPVNQPLRSRVLKRSQPNKYRPPFPAAPSQAPYISNWVHPVNQPLKRVRRVQVPKRILVNQPLAVNTWLARSGQPQRRYPKRPQPAPRRNNPFYAIVITSVVPVLTSWIHPVNQFLRKRVLRRQQPDYQFSRGHFDPLPNPPPPAYSVIVSSHNQTITDNNSTNLETVSSHDMIETVSSETNSTVAQSKTKNTTVQSGSNQETID